MREFGLAAVLSFKDQASAAMGRVKGRAEAMGKAFSRISGGVGQMSQGLGKLTAMAVPVTIGLLGAASSGLKFEQAIANLRAVTLDTSNKTTPALEAMALSLGSTTTFSATQAAEAMTELAKAGFTNKQVMEAVPGVLSAAAAEGMDLASAANIVVANVNAFNLSASEAGKVAGTLALASAQSASSIADLQEGMKYAAPAVRATGAKMSDVVAIMAAMSNMGVGGQMAGTAIQQMMARLGSGTKAVTEAFGGRGAFNETLKKAGFFQGDLIGTTQAIIKLIAQEHDPLKRLEKATAIFGVRAQKMGIALDLTGEKAEKFKSDLEGLRAETGSTAKQMAQIQLATMGGQLTMLKAAAEGLSIQMFKMFAPETSGIVKSLADNMGKLALAMRVASGEKFTDPKDIAAVKDLPLTFIQIAQGIREGFGEAKQIIVDVAKKLGFDIGGQGAGGIAKVITKVTLLTAAMAPLLLGAMGVGKAFGGIADIGIGAAKTAGGILGMAGGMLGGKGKVLGTVGKLASAAGNLTATPVRVVNWNEAPGGLGGGLPDIPGLPPGPGTSAGGLLGKLGGAVKGIAGVAAAGAAGYAIGTLATDTIPKFFGAKNGLGEAIGNKVGYNAANDTTIDEMIKAHAAKKAAINGYAPQDIMSPAASAREQLLRSTTGVLMDKQDAQAAAGRGGAATPQKVVEKMEISIPLKLDGKEIARSQTEIHLQDIDRSGGKMAPGSRRGAMTRGTIPQKQ